MALEDPEVQKGLLATIAAFLSGTWFAVGRHIRRYDDLEKVVSEIQINHPTRTELNYAVQRIEDKLDRLINGLIK